MIRSRALISRYLKPHYLKKIFLHPEKNFKRITEILRTEKEREKAFLEFANKAPNAQVKLFKKYAGEFYKTQVFKITSAESPGRIGEFDVKVLYTLCRFIRPAIVVETGVSGGKSSTAILEALNKNGHGHLYSIDLPLNDPPHLKNFFWIPKGEKPGWLISDRLRDRWTLLIGSSQEQLPPLLEKLGTIDLFLHDSDHTYDVMLFEFRTAWQYLREGGFLLSDDVTWNEAFNDFCKEVSRKSFIRLDFGILPK